MRTASGNGINLDSLVCIDARTGKRVWHYQTVHHDLWDYDLPTAPILADLNVGGKKIKAVLQVTKMAYVCSRLDRVTGKPISGRSKSVRCPRPTVPGEWTSPTQPFPTKPAPFDRIGLTDADLIDFTPDLHRQALEIMNRYVHGEIFTPPSLKGSDKLGTIYLPGWVGGANWTGAAIDPETKILYIPSVERAVANRTGEAWTKGRLAAGAGKIVVSGWTARFAAGEAALWTHHGDRYESRRTCVDGRLP